MRILITFWPDLPRGYDLLTAPQSHASGATAEQQTLHFTPNPAYDRYLRIHKVLVGPKGADLLVDIHDSLSQETMPRYLAAAGWAATEAALVQTNKSTDQRLELLRSGVECWTTAIDTQKGFNDKTDQPYLIEPSLPHRMALDVACAPLFAGIVQGDVEKSVCEEVFTDCLNIAESNAVRINLASRDNNIDAVADHLGLGYECNAILSFNRRMRPNWFATPSTVRSDSGYYHPRQTHDVQVINQNWGAIKSVTPVEIKSAASARDRSRFSALIVRGKMHLSVEGKFGPDQTLGALAAAYSGVQTAEQANIAATVGERMLDMVKKYQEGGATVDFAPMRSATAFHDHTRVSALYPGIQRAS